MKNADKNVIEIFLTEKSIMEYSNHQRMSHTVLSYAREQNKKFGKKFVEMIENKMKEAGLEVPAQHSQPPVGAGGPTSQKVGATSGTQPLFSQSRYRQPSVPFNSSDDESEHHDNPKSPTFWSENKGKIAAGLGVMGVICVVGALALKLSVAIACTVAVIGALATLTAIGIAGKMAYDTVSERAKEDGTSKWEAIESVLGDMLPGSIKPHKTPQPGVVD